MTATPILALDELASGQAIPEVTVNEAIRWLEFFGAGGKVLDRGLTAEPGSPADGDAYLLPGSPTGTHWSGQGGKIALYVSTAWEFKAPKEGMTLYVADEDLRIVYDGAAWNSASSTGGGGTAGTLDFDTDGALAANSDAKVATQKATKTYVDGKVAGLSWKQAVRVASTANGTLASAFENGDTVDGVVLVTGDRILLKNQSSGAENGIYTVNASGAPTRATDADSGAELVNASVYVSEGTFNADTQWTCTTNAPITPGSTSLTFAQFTSASSATINQGVHTIPIPAAAMVARTTGGAASGTTESATNKVMTRTLDFDASTDEFAQVSIPMHKSWDEGTITVQFIWTAGTTGDVVWGAQAQYQRDDDPVDGAWGTAQTVTDSVTASGDRMVSGYTSAITPAGTGGNECSLLIQVYRDGDNGSDTLAADAKLIAIRVKYTVNASDDS